MENNSHLINGLNSKEIWEQSWEDTELYKEIRRIISSKTTNYTIDEKLDELIKNIPNIISSFKDCSSEEEYRMLAKKSDGTLATIQVKDNNTGFQVYSPISLNAYEYKKFYFETLLYCVLTYIMFFKDIEFKIMCNDDVRSGTLSITDNSLPHLLGLEAKFVSSKDCELIERIIPSYNTLDILDKILCLIENNEKIIQYELDNNVDIFNYYKSMQKNKEFLMLGRFFNKDEENTADKNKIFLMSNSNNQLCLYKKSNMNENMNRNICKVIIQKALTGEYFPRSLQSVSDEMLEGFDVFNFLSGGKHNIVLEGEDFQMNCQDMGIDGYSLDISNATQMRGYMYSRLFYQDSDIDKSFEGVEKLIKSMSLDKTSNPESISQILENIKQKLKVSIEPLNDIDLKSQFLMMYINEATNEQLRLIDELLYREDYQKINDILEKYIQNIINNKDIKDFDSGDSSPTMVKTSLDFDDINQEYFDLYYTLALINLYFNETDEEERQLLYEELQTRVKIYKKEGHSSSKKTK